MVPLTFWVVGLAQSDGNQSKNNNLEDLCTAATNVVLHEVAET